MTRKYTLTDGEAWIYDVADRNGMTLRNDLRVMARQVMDAGADGLDIFHPAGGELLWTYDRSDLRENGGVL